MKIKKCNKCLELPKITKRQISKNESAYVFKCKCGSEKELVLTGYKDKESAIRAYNAVYLDDGDIVLQVRIDKNNIISISCDTLQREHWYERINAGRKNIIGAIQRYGK